MAGLEESPAWEVREKPIHHQDGSQGLQRGWSQWVDVGGSVVHVSAQARTDRPWPTMRLDYNPARIADPEGWRMATVGEALESVSLVMDAVAGLVTLACPVEDTTVTRLDSGKDLGGVSDPSTTLAAVGRYPAPWSRLNTTHQDPHRNGVLTLTRGSKSAGLIRAYDKCAETRGEAPEGTLRFETEGRRGWLSNYGGIKRLGDVTPASVEAFARNRFVWSGMGSEVAGSVSDLWVALRSRTELSEREAVFAVGYLSLKAAGQAPPVSKATAAKLGRAQREAGVCAPLDLTAVGIEVVRRLDWDSATEVVSVRAA